MQRDIHSQARPDQVRVHHLDLNLRADFEKKTLTGTATFQLTRDDSTQPLILDTEGLTIDRVTDGDGAALEFLLGAHDPILGAPLSITLGDGTQTVAVHYQTAPDAAAVQWLDPRQTSGDHPFLFTQGQAILTRSWIPCQDSPGVRLSYNASITVPAALRAVMSAEQLTADGDPGPTPGERTYRFRLTHPIPSYLIALAIGRLEFRATGARTGVYAEPEVIEAAAYEFAETEEMVTAAERLYGPYRWGRYDLLVLPASFPFGGMENPCLTFATPTIIAGDRSLTALVAHELAHSWSGNLVTNAEWADLWLNEGFTVYFEGRIMEEVFGEDYFRMLSVLGWQDLQSDLDELGRDHGDTCLHQDLSGRNPDDAFSNVPYEKGALFLRTIEQHVGRARFDEFLREYFDAFAFQPMTADRFVDHLSATLFADDPDGLESLELHAWIYEPGLLDTAQRPTSDAFTKVDQARDRFLKDGDAAAIDVAAWTTHQWLHFLRGMPTEVALDRMVALDDSFGLTNRGNREVQFEWLRIAIRNQYGASFPALRAFLNGVGRRKFLKPLYQDLIATPWGLPLAREIYAEARGGYHSVSYRTIDQLFDAAGP